MKSFSLSEELTGYTKICPLNELRESEGKRFMVDDVDIALFRIQDKVYAVNNRCPHQQSALIYDGFVEDGFVICPAHGWMFDLKSGRTLGQELLLPTRIYHESLAVASTCIVHGMCHITGGGLLNFKRLSPHGFLFSSPLTPQEIFSWIQKSGDISTVEMYRTFNMGMGYAYIVPGDSTARVLKAVKGAKIVGEIIEEPGVWLRDIEIT